MPLVAPTQRHHRACTLCEAMCGVVIETRGREVVSIRGDQDDPFSKGHVCPKAVALKDIHDDPDRQRHPLRRKGDSWERISWDEALDETAARLAAVQKKHGRDAVAMYMGNPTVHNYGAMLFGPPLRKLLRTRNKFSATSVDQLPHQLAAYLMFGHQLLLPVPDIDRSDYMLILGANPGASNGSLMSAPDAVGRLDEIRKRGGEVVLLDPRRSETAAHATRHLFIRPGTDAYFLAAVLNTIFDENLARPGRLEAFTGGIDAARQALRAVSPERAAALTGIPLDEIRRIARAFAAAPRAVCYGRFGASTQRFGGLAHWLINLLNLVTGNLDREGGAMFTLPAVDMLAAQSPGSYGRWHSRVRKFPEACGELPVAVLAEEILTPGDGQVRAFVTLAGNPVLSTPNGTQLDKALASLEFMVSIDFYINETTRHAHILLPPQGPLEHEHYDFAFNLLAVRNTAKFSPAVVAPEPGTRADWEILLGLQRRLETTAKGKLSGAALGLVGPERMLDVGLRTGPYGKKFRGLGGLSLAHLKKHPHGVDLGPLTPQLPGRLRTANRTINAAPDLYLQDLGRVAREAAAPQTEGGYDLLLIGRRQLRSNNSWLHNSERMMKGPRRFTLLVHPQDAARLGLADGAEAELASRTGTVRVPVQVSDEVMPGVVSLPHGWGHRRGGVKLAVAQKYDGASINDVTDDQLLDPLSGNAVLCGVPVRVQPIG